MDRVHAAGLKVIHQAHTVRQAREAAERGVDVVIAQGGEAGGQGMAAGVGAMALVPQVVDAVSEEAAADEAWKRLILEAESEEAVRFEAWRAIMPSTGAGYDVVPRVIRAEFVAEWESRPDEATTQADVLRGQIMASIQERRPHALTPFTGQTVGLIHDVRPAAEIVRGMVTEAENALGRAYEQIAG